MAPREVIIAEPCGFCSGVRKALGMIEKKLESTSENIYILKGLIHNNGITAELRRSGCIFVEDVEDIPPGSETVFGAHGVSAKVKALAAE